MRNIEEKVIVIGAIKWFLLYLIEWTRSSSDRSSSLPSDRGIPLLLQLIIVIIRPNSVAQYHEFELTERKRRTGQDRTEQDRTGLARGVKNRFKRRFGAKVSEIQASLHFGGLVRFGSGCCCFYYEIIHQVVVLSRQGFDKRQFVELCLSSSIRFDHFFVFVLLALGAQSQSQSESPSSSWSPKRQQAHSTPLYLI